jgi:sarcosine oxidase subunit delta
VRDEPEFAFGGPAHLVRPSPSVDDAVWTRYLFARDNPAGVHHERWLHAYGCGLWFDVARDTTTHEFRAVYERGASASERIDP